MNHRCAAMKIRTSYQTQPTVPTANRSFGQAELNHWPGMGSVVQACRGVLGWLPLLLLCVLSQAADGQNELDGTKTFAQHRPGWQLPIHDLLVKHDVSIVFHGHDHLYAKEEMDGIIYQAVPQPGHPRFGNVRSAEEYGYHGEVISSSGHLRISVSADTARVDYVRAYLPKDETVRRTNGEISASYFVK